MGHFLKFAQYRLLESTELKQAGVRPMSKVEDYYVNNFLDLLNTVLAYVENRNKTVDDFYKFVDEIKGYRKFNFAKGLFRDIDNIIKQLSDADNVSSQKNSIYQSYFADIDKLGKLFLSSDSEAILKFNIMNIQNLRNKLDKMNINKSNVISFRNPFEVAATWLFATSNFLDAGFTKDDMIEVIEKDTTKFKYTYLELPISKLDNFQYLVYFIQKLTDSEKPVRLMGSEFIKWSDMLYADYSAISDLVQKYLYNNNKSLISEILKLLPKYPDLYNANEITKKQTKEVYRGLGFYDNIPSTADIKKEEISKGMVATSKSLYTATLFAEMRGHMEAERRNKAGDGRIITYSVSPKSIIIDFSIFGSAFGESEILIDTKRAKIKNIESH